MYFTCAYLKNSSTHTLKSTVPSPHCTMGANLFFCSPGSRTGPADASPVNTGLPNRVRVARYLKLFSYLSLKISTRIWVSIWNHYPIWVLRAGSPGKASLDVCVSTPKVRKKSADELLKMQTPNPTLGLSWISVWKVHRPLGKHASVYCWFE